MTERRRAQPSANHHDHDRLLIVRLAGDDLFPGEAEAAQTLTERCEACAALATELRAIRSAMSALPVPRRTRDFRISDDQARSLRGSWLERVMRRIASPGMGVMQPLAGAVMSIGIVLAVAGVTLPTAVPAPSTEREMLFQAAAPTEPAEDGATTSGGAPAAAEVPSGTIDPQAMPAGPTSTEAAEAPAESPAAEAPGAYGPAAGLPSAKPERVDTGRDVEGSSRPMTGIGEDASATVRPQLDALPAADLDADRSPSDTPPGLLLVAIGAVFTVLGLLLIGLRSFARRATADRLLR